MEHLLEVKNLSVTIDGFSGEVQAVRDVSFSLKKGEVLAIVGESGCGKSVLCKSIMKLLPPSAKIKEGSICVNGQDITCYREKEMQKLRGRVFSMIFQDPMTSLNPTIKIGKQIGEAVVIHNKNYTKEQVNKKVLELMELVGISHPKERYHQYPWQFSGGMRQRCVMAIALAADPDILFADEPTTALDVTIQAQILDLLREYMEVPGRSIVISSHISGDLEHFCDDLYMIHEGKIVLHEETDVLLGEYAVLKVDEAQYQTLDKQYILCQKKTPFGHELLTDQKQFYLENYPKVVVEKGTVDEAILMMIKGERV